MHRNIQLERLQRLDKEKRLDPNYVNIERDAKKHGWKKKRDKKAKVKTKKKSSVNRVPKVKQSTYPIFLKSAYWKYVHNLVVNRDGFKCVKCGNEGNLQVHHLTYKHHYKEHLHLGDLVTLCRDCHRLEHDLGLN